MENMKQYVTPDMEVFEFDTEDVITTSITDSSSKDPFEGEEV